MNKAAGLQAISAKPQPASSPNLLLQPKCICGNSAGLSGECEECTRTKLLGSHTKLAISGPNDPYEQEADRVAEQVIGMPVPIGEDEKVLPVAEPPMPLAAVESGFAAGTAGDLRWNVLPPPSGPLDPSSSGPFPPQIVASFRRMPSERRDDYAVLSPAHKPKKKPEREVQRLCAACQQNDEEPSIDFLQRHAASPQSEADPGAELADAAPQRGKVHEAIQGSGGNPLPVATRHFFESRFNRDFSAVRVHIGPTANDLCRRLDAHAFTHGNHVWLGDGISSAPSFVMAHELAHVVQQTQPKALDRLRGGVLAQLQSPPGVRRLPFWVPISGKKGKPMTGSELHKELLEAIGGKKKVEIEAPVPNATRSGHGLGLQGFADLYRASSRVGVYFNARQGLGVGDSEGNERYTHPAKTKKAGSDPKPVATRGGGIDKIGDGPKTVELGELKPAAKTELAKGDTQLGHYEKGFKDAAELTNAWSDSRKSKDPTAPKPKWSLASVTRLPEGDVQISPRHDPADATTGTDRLLALADIDENAPRTGQSEAQSKYTVRRAYTPKTYLGEEIRGKLYMEPFGNGLWMYYARPTNFEAALNLPRFRREEVQGLMVVAGAVQDEVIGTLKRGPEQVQTLRRAVSPVGRLMPALVRIRRKAKKAKLKDHFDQKAYDKWSKRQTLLGKEIRSEDKTKTTQQTFKRLEFLELASTAEGALDAKVKNKGTGFPKTDDLKLKIETGSGTSKVTKNTGLDRVFDWLERWTSKPYKVLGKFRQIFGSGFVTAVNKFSAIKEKISTKVQDFFKKRTKTKKTAGLLVKALGRALKQVVDLIVPQTMHLLTEAIGNGLRKKVEALFQDTFVETAIGKFEGWIESIKNYAAQAEAKIEKVKEDFVKEFKWVDDIVDQVAWFARIVKAGRVLLKCRKPPLLGCLGLLRDAAKDHELNCVLCIPWVQKQVAEKVMAVPWFTNMPAELANLILKTLHDAVPDKAEILRDVFAEKVTNQSPNIEDLMPECDVKCEGFLHFEGVKGPGGEIKKEDAETAEKIADFSEKLSKEQIEELLHEAERRGMVDQPFDQEKTEELLKELEENRKKKEAEEAAKPPQEKKAEEDRKQQSEAKKPPPASKQRKQEPPKRSPKQSPRQPGDWKPEGRNAPRNKGQGKREGGQCAWSPGLIDLRAWVLEPLDDDLSENILATGSTFAPFPNNSIKAKCAGRFQVKNDFGLGWCSREGKFTAPAVTTEITFNGKELFKRTDKKPKVHSSYYIKPTWGDRITLDPIDKDGELRIKLTLFDPDTGTTTTFDGKVKIEILTKDLCCDCIS